MRKRGVSPTIPDGLLIDDEDFHFVERHSYSVRPSDGYVTAKVRRGGTRTGGNGIGRNVGLYLHREILKQAPGLVVDHINGNNLDNRKANLRVITTSANSHNLHSRGLLRGIPPRMRASGHSSWSVRVEIYHKVITLGTRACLCEALALMTEWRARNPIEAIHAETLGKSFFRNQYIPNQTKQQKAKAS